MEHLSRPPEAFADRHGSASLLCHKPAGLHDKLTTVPLSHDSIAASMTGWTIGASSAFPSTWPPAAARVPPVDLHTTPACGIAPSSDGHFPAQSGQTVDFPSERACSVARALDTGYVQPGGDSARTLASRISPPLRGTTMTRRRAEFRTMGKGKPVDTLREDTAQPRVALQSSIWPTRTR